MTLWSIAPQTPLSVGFSRQEYWSALSWPPPGDLPNPGIKPASLMSPALASGFLTSSTTWEAQAFIISLCCAMLCLVAQSCPTLCNPMDCSPPGSFVHGNSPGKNTGVGCHALLQGIFPTQGLNPGLPHCRQILNQLSYPGKPS